MSDDTLKVPLEVVKSILANGRDGFVSKADADSLRELLAQPSDGALTNEPVAWTNPLELEIIADTQFAELVYLGRAKTDRLTVALYRHPPAIASVILPPLPEVPEEPAFADDDSHMDAYHAARRMRSACAKAIAAAGLTVEP
jgi:hypothetical protein